MPEEPDVSPEELAILDRVLLKQIEARSQQCEEERINAIADRIVEALESRPDGMPWQEIRAMFDNSHSDEEIRQALVSLMQTPLTLTRQTVKKTSEHSGERFLLAAG